MSLTDVRGDERAADMASTEGWAMPANAKVRRGPRPPSMPHPEIVASIKGREEDEAKSSAGLASKAGRLAGNVGGRVGKQISKKHACERAFVCALAVCLLWVTSLAVSQELVKYFIPTPSYEKVLKLGEGFFNTSKGLRSDYEVCAIESSIACEQQLETELNNENRRVFETQEFLDEKLAENKATLQECQVAYYDAVRALEYMQTNLSLSIESDEYFNTTNPACDPALLTSVVSNQVISAQAISEVENFKAASDEAVDSLDHQLQERILYDLNYLDGKTGGFLSSAVDQLNGNLSNAAELTANIRTSFDNMMACFKPTGRYGEKGLCSESPLFADARNEFDAGVKQYNELREDAEAYRDEAYQKYARYELLYNKIKDIYDKLDGPSLAILLSNGFELIDIGDLTDRLGSLLNIDLNLILDGPDKIYETLELEAQKQIDALTGEGSAIDAANKDFKAKTAAMENAAFGDYDPPPVDDDDYDSSSAEIVGKVTTDLGAVQANDQDQPVLQELVQKKQLNATDAASKLLEKADPRTWSFYQYQDAVFERFRNGFQSVNDVAVNLDIAYRVLKSLVVIRKYWMISAVATPPADVRCEEGINAGMFSAKKNVLQSVAGILTHPIVNLLLVIFFLSLFASSFYVAYGPIINEYSEGCVNRCWTNIKNDVVDNGTKRYAAEADGTMLYRNAFAVANQYVFVDGDYVVSTKIDALSVERELTCRDQVVAAFDKRLQQDDTHEFYNSRQATVVKNMAFLHECVRFDPLRNDTLKSDLKSGINVTINEQLGNKTFCSSTFLSPDEVVERLDPTIQDQRIRRFDCGKLSPCKLLCDGPNEAILRGSAHDATCVTEWFFHSTTLGSILTVVVFFLLNLSRMIFLRGATKVWWRHLVSNRFSYLASCTESGRVIYSKAVTEKGESFRKVIKKQLRIALRSFEREGYVELLFALLFNVPWIVTLVILRKNLIFDENKICGDV